MSSDVRTISTPQGDARIHAERAVRPVACLALAHGAGGGIDAPDLVALNKALPKLGISVFRIEQPWQVAGKKMAPRPAALDESTVCCMNAIRVRSPIIMGGRSAGARVACRIGRQMGAVGCLALAFPLHPPGKPDRSRLDELEGAQLPTFVVQGERDPFGKPEEFPDHVDLTVIPDADHSFRVPKRAELDQKQTLALITEAVVEWVTARVG